MKVYSILPANTFSRQNIFQQNERTTPSAAYIGKTPRHDSVSFGMAVPSAKNLEKLFGRFNHKYSSAEEVEGILKEVCRLSKIAKKYILNLRDENDNTLLHKMFSTKSLKPKTLSKCLGELKGSLSPEENREIFTAVNMRGNTIGHIATDKAATMEVFMDTVKDLPEKVLKDIFNMRNAQGHTIGEVVANPCYCCYYNCEEFKAFMKGVRNLPEGVIRSIFKVSSIGHFALQEASKLEILMQGLKDLPEDIIRGVLTAEKEGGTIGHLAALDTKKLEIFMKGLRSLPQKIAADVLTNNHPHNHNTIGHCSVKYPRDAAKDAERLKVFMKGVRDLDLPEEVLTQIYTMRDTWENTIMHRAANITRDAEILYAGTPSPGILQEYSSEVKKLPQAVQDRLMPDLNKMWFKLDV